MTKYIFTFLLFLFLQNNLAAQKLINWSYLGDVKYEVKYSEELGYNLHIATFGKSIKNLDGKEVIISGHMIPLDPMGISYVLSQNPNSSCFFCGGAGPETVLELELKPSAIKRYEVDSVVEFKGILKLNKIDDKHLTYVLLEAEPN
jgi:hypothetical protein